MMKTTRHWILLSAQFYMLLGLWLFWPPRYQRINGTAFFLTLLIAGFGIILWNFANLALLEERRRLASGLMSLHAATALLAFMIRPAGPASFLLAVAALALAAGIWWVREEPEELASADLDLPGVPDEIRRRWLRQAGEAAALEERNRLARDLHDSIKQQLFSINVGTAAVQELWDRDPGRAREALADVRRSAREAMTEMNAMLHQLRPEALASAGLVEALREQCEALGYRTGAKVSLELGDTLRDDRLFPGTQEEIFRIAQEALANVARHARAREVRVFLGLEGDSVLLRITDDGQGFDPLAAPSGMGLRNLRERAESLHGALDLRSAPGEGTTVSVHIPLAPPPASEREPARESRFETHRKRAFQFLVVGWLPIYYWSRVGEEWNAWKMLAVALTLLFILPPAFELLRLHRVSQAGPGWRLYLAGAAGLAVAAVLIPWLRTPAGLVTAAEALMLGYALSRQPRPEGAAS